MATIRVMYWKEIPSQVKATDEHGAVSRMLDSRFQEGIDAIGMFDGSCEAGAYLDGWEWGEPLDLPGRAEDAVTSLAERYNTRFPHDFVARIRELQRAGTRDPQPGAVDHWMEEA
ncbi:MAG: virulence factor [Chloroflexi bacterium]|nr:virulence factor [Chloroflexota bacterium]